MRTEQAARLQMAQTPTMLTLLPLPALLLPLEVRRIEEALVAV